MKNFNVPFSLQEARRWSEVVKGRRIVATELAEHDTLADAIARVKKEVHSVDAWLAIFAHAGDVRELSQLQEVIPLAFLQEERSSSVQLIGLDCILRLSQAVQISPVTMSEGAQVNPELIRLGVRFAMTNMHLLLEGLSGVLMSFRSLGT